jgi:hypothetical protein
MRWWCLALGSCLVLSACVDDEIDVPPLGETAGETASDDEGEPLPTGENCGPNWYEIDGVAIAAQFDEPEARSGALTDLGVRVEFSGPVPPTVVVPPEPFDPSFAGMTHEQFVARYAEPYGHDWFVEGDQPMTDATLRELSEQLRAPLEVADGATPRAATFEVGGFDATWSSSRKLALTWCLGRIMPSPFTNQETHDLHVKRTLEAIEWATRAWERAADVNFVHLAEFDSPESYASGDCQPGENGIHFRVRTGSDCIQNCGGVTMPEAHPMSEFLDPADVEGTAEVVLGLQRFMHNDTDARIIALHELGHVLGFTHEHLRWLELQDPKSDTCQENKDIPWRGVTPADPHSVMAIDDCVGVAKNVPVLSDWDRLGAYYGYTWAHRRTAMMEPVSGIDDYAYDGTGRTGILWQTSRSDELELWTSIADPGEPIAFEQQILCADGSAGPCMGDFDERGRVRPVPAFLTGGVSDLDILAHGPGSALDDVLLRNDGGALDPWDIVLDGFSIPIVGSFGAGIDDQILLYRPGPEGDALLVANDGGVSMLPFEYDGYAYPLAGRYRGFDGGGTDILWYNPHENEFSVWAAQCCDGFGFGPYGPSDATNLGLDNGVEYTPLVGDFNGDERTDIFWYSAGEGADVMWWSESNQDVVAFAAAGTNIDRDYRPFLGDFDANGTTDILWFAPYDEVVHTTSKIWYFAEDETFVAYTLSTHHDYSPYVADFDDDGCSDIFWYKPDDPNRESPIWRCIPHSRDFDCDPPQSAPAGAYPIGFGGAY